MINKHFDNDKAIGAVGILAALIFYVFILSIILSVVLIDMYGANVIQNITLPSQKDIKTFSSDQNFANCTADKSTLLRQTQGEWLTTCGIGTTLISTHGNAYLLINNIQKDELGLYQNSYWVNNSATNLLGLHGDYTIVLRYTGGGDQNEIIVTQDGFHIPQYFYVLTIRLPLDLYYYPYLNANQITSTTIKTIYDDNAHTVDFYFNGNKMFTTDQLNEDKNLVNLFGRYYGGVASFTTGFTLEDFNTEGKIISGLSSNIGDNINSMLDLLTTILKISTWQIPAWILPPLFIAVFLNLPEAGIVVCVAIIVFRGVD
jgi:hypothetical protein